MPPKKAPRKTKKQIEEELKKAEEDKKIQEELDRKKAEEDEKLRVELEKKRQEEEEKRALEEKARLAEEEEKTVDINRQLKEKVHFLDTDLKERGGWEKYLKCEMLPDPSQEKDLTTHLTLWSERKDKNLQECVNNCQIAEDIIKAIHFILSEAQAEYQNNKIITYYQYINQLRAISRKKLDDITCHILENIEEQLRIKPEEMHLYVKSHKIASSGDPPTTKPEFVIAAEVQDVKIGIWGNHSSKVFKHQPLKFGDVGIACDVPRNWMTHPVIMRATWISYNDISSNFYCPYLVVGGILDVELFQFPKMAKKAKNWMMRNIYDVEHMLIKINYPDTNSNAPQPVNPLKVQYKVPNYQLIFEKDEIRVGWWDNKSLQWSAEGIEELSYDRSEHMLYFRTNRLAPMAYLQDRCTDYPYTSWKLRCVEDEKAILDIEGKRMTITFEIGSGYCMLIERDEEELKHLIGKKMEPGVLLHELSRSGIHLMPIDEDGKRANLQVKVFEAEERAIMDIALAVRAFAFRCSRWNKSVGADHLIVKIRENVEFDREFFEDHETDWRYIDWQANKCSFVKVSDIAETADISCTKGHTTHAYLSLALKDYCSEVAYDRIFQFSYVQFVQTVKRCLRLLRLLSFS